LRTILGVTVMDDELLALLRPCADETLKIWKVDKRVGNVRNTGPELVAPI
jgi:putative SOS response-associated peptidase YedK